MQRCTPKEAAALVRPVDTLALPLGPGQPVELMRALGERDDYDDLTIFSALLTALTPLFTRRGVHLRSGFFGPIERGLSASGHDVHFVPGDFRRFALIGQRLAPRVIATCAAPPDEHGRFSLSLHAGATVEELKAAGRDPERLLVVETSPHLPRTLGVPPEHPHWLEPDLVDVWVESEMKPIVLEEGEPSDVEHAIAEIVRGYVHDGCTLQTGIGGIPNEVVKLLAAGDGGDYGIHSEMFTTGLMHLHESGKVRNRKGVYDGVSVTTFALGTRDLYDWLDGREDVRFLPVDLVNDPALIARNHDMVSINGALSVDLAGQIAADAIDGRQHSGIGGHEDFVAGAGLARGGHSLVCLPSTAGRGDARVSRIVRAHAPGTLVTTPRHQADVIITEHGAAELVGLTMQERARALAAIAHPDFRAELLD